MLEARLLELAKSEPGVLTTNVNSWLRRAVFSFDPARVSCERIVELVERAEQDCGLGGQPFGAELPEHPADLEPLVRLLVETGADVTGFSMAILGRLLPFRPLTLSVDLLALVSTLEGMPALRERVDARLGPTVASLWLGVGTAIAQGLAQSPLGPLVDIAHRSFQAVERLSRRRVWLEREDALFRVPCDHGMLAAGPGPRPVPMPLGAIERYASVAMSGSAGAFGLGVAMTGSVAAASGMLVGALPRPALLGRDAFAAILAYRLGHHGVLSVDPTALRHLDRVDCMLVPATLAEKSGYAELVAAAGEAGFTCEAIAAKDDPCEAVRRRQREGHVVLLVSDRPTRAIADVTVGLVVPGAVPPWGAHFLAGSSLDDARPIVLACAEARRVAQESVRIGEAGLAIGALAILGERIEQTTTWHLATTTQVASLVAMINGARRAWSMGLDTAVATRDETAWHALDPGEALARLRSGLEGITDEEAERRVEPPPPPPTLLDRIVRAVGEELSTPLAPILAVGAGLSAAIGAVTDAALIGTVVAANAALGAVEKLRTEDAIAGLRSDRPRTVRVVRAGRLQTIPATALVCGDLVQLDAGELVPADCRIVEAYGLEADESSLTGESLPVVKHAAPIEADEIAERGSILYEGTAIAAGSALAVAFAVGPCTEANRAAAAAGDMPATGVEARLASLVDWTGPIAVGSGALVAVAGMLRGRPLRELVSTAVSLTVAAVPEGLPMVATVAQLASARRLSRRGVLVRNARAIEALGRAQVLCLDKTGTLTEGRIALRCVSDGNRTEPAEDLGATSGAILRVALRATPRARDGQRLPHGTDRALVAAAKAASVHSEEDDEWMRLSELPFESERGFHAVLGRARDGLKLSVKGAPEIVLPRCTARRVGAVEEALDDPGREELASAALELARCGLRVLAVAETSVAENGELRDERVSELTFRGLLGLADPVRPSALEAIEGLRRAGVRVVMITGDHPSTAESIAAELGLGDGERTVTGSTLDELDDDELACLVPRIGVFARVAPRHKARIVDAFERAGLVVGMTGDGANDAAAIRRASVGIAVGRHCTTAARNAADIVVTDDRIEALVDVLLEGRAMWSSVRDALATLLGGNLGEVVFTVAASLATGSSPLNARQLLLMNLLTDTVPALAVAMRPPPTVDPEALIREGPEASLGAPLLRDILWRGALGAASSGGAWTAARSVMRSPRASTVGLVALVGTQLGQTLVVGGRSPLVVGASLGSFAALAAIVQTPGLSHFFGCRPLGPLGWTIVGAATGMATGASIVLPRVVPALDPWLESLGTSLVAAGASWFGEEARGDSTSAPSDRGVVASSA